MAIFTVTFATMDQDTGANPFWHTFLFLSRLDEATKKMEVVETWGFYGNPPSSKNTFARKLKAGMGLETDFYGNHGTLKHEELRYLDLGCGLHGTTFEITEEQFNELSNRCKKMDEEHRQAVAEALPKIGEVKLKAKCRNYKEEDHALQIYETELAKAKEEKREPRLKPFTLVSTKGCVYTCKGQVLDLLGGILAPVHIERLKGGHYAISRLSGKMENVFLHSRGQLHTHTKSSGKSIKYRDFADKDVRLFWSIPPQEIVTNSAKTHALLTMPSKFIPEVEKVVSQLQKIEWLIINANLTKEHDSLREKVLQQIQNCYEAFSIINPKTIPDWRASLTKVDKEQSGCEIILSKNLANANALINSLFSEAVKLFRELDVKPVSANEDVAGLVKLLSAEDKTQLCVIVGDTEAYLTQLYEKSKSAVNGIYNFMSAKISQVPAALFSREQKAQEEAVWIARSVQKI